MQKRHVLDFVTHTPPHTPIGKIQVYTLAVSRLCVRDIWYALLLQHRKEHL